MSWVAVGGTAISAVGSIVGGVLGGKKKGGGSQTIYNEALDNYTQGYSNSAAYSFATLDPQATIAYRKTQGTAPRVGSRLDVAAKEEIAQQKASNEAMKRIEERQASGQFLTEEETNFINTSLDKAYESSRNIAFQNWERGAQSLAGRQGLRTSDTPVAQPAMQALRDIELGFASDRAGKGLDATMKMSLQQNAFDESLMTNLNNLQFNRWSTRMGHLFGGGMQGIAGIRSSGNVSSYGFSGAGAIQGAQSGFEMAKGVGGMLQSIGSSTPEPVPVGGGGYGGMMGLTKGSVGGMFG